MPSLIISPHGGIGNRLRAINSAMIIGSLTGRTVFHAWLPSSKIWTSSEQMVWPDWYKRIRLYPLEHFFEAGPSLTPVPAGFPVDLVLSEWAPGDWWFPMQSSGQSYLNITAESRSENIFSSVASSVADVILLETTLRTWPGDCPGINRSLPAAGDRLVIHEFYRKLRPLPKYIELLDCLGFVDAGIWIREGDLKDYFPAADQAFEVIADWIESLKDRFATIAIFSIDDELADRLYVRCRLDVPQGLFSRAVCDLPRHEKAMFDFLFLAMKSNFIFGTPGSSFAQEAALFGLRPYAEVLGEAWRE